MVEKVGWSRMNKCCWSLEASVNCTQCMFTQSGLCPEETDDGTSNTYLYLQYSQISTIQHSHSTNPSKQISVQSNSSQFTFLSNYPPFCQHLCGPDGCGNQKFTIVSWGVSNIFDFNDLWIYDPKPIHALFVNLMCPRTISLNLTDDAKHSWT